MSVAGVSRDTRTRACRNAKNCACTRTGAARWPRRRAILASAVTVALGLLCLLFADLAPDSGLGAKGFWVTVANGVARRPKLIGASTVVVLAALAFAVTDVHIGLTNDNSFTTTPESVAGQQLYAGHFPSGSTDPTINLSTKDSAAAASATDGMP